MSLHREKERPNHSFPTLRTRYWQFEGSEKKKVLTKLRKVLCLHQVSSSYFKKYIKFFYEVYFKAPNKSNKVSITGGCGINSGVIFNTKQRKILLYLSIRRNKWSWSRTFNFLSVPLNVNKGVIKFPVDRSPTTTQPPLQFHFLLQFPL